MTDKQVDTVFVQGMRGFAPGLSTDEAWADWLGGDVPYNSDLGARPPCKMIPPIYRRRCSLLTRMVLETCLGLTEDHNIDPATLVSVFASRHGEIGLLEGLFESMSASEPMSPVNFANSVHNTATGYLGIVAKNTGLTRTVSAGPGSFACGLLEVFSVLSKQPDATLALISADLPLPEAFGHAQGDVPFPHAVTFLLTAAAREQGMNHPVTLAGALGMLGTAGTDSHTTVFEFMRSLT